MILPASYYTRCDLMKALAVIVLLLPGTGFTAEGLYPQHCPELDVAINRELQLTAAEKRPVPLKIFYPQTGGPYPLVVLSHGTFSSIDRYDLIANYWAAQGYVVILPQHKDANYGVRPTSYAVMQGVAMSRVEDMSRVLDELATLEQQLPILASKINHDHYVAAGHSMGTQVAMLVTGMQFKTGYSGELMAASEDRFAALILISDPGKMRLMPEDTWQASNVPTFMATGTDDFGVMGQRSKSAEAQSEVLPSDARVDRYSLLLEGGDHYFGGLIQKEVDAEPDAEGLAIFNATSVGFLDAYIKDSSAAKIWLDEVDMQQATGQRALLDKWGQSKNN
jgi:dienelactone hydrolase